jgi:branched-chain amino acid transport system substrate-binding protein
MKHVYKLGSAFGGFAASAVLLAGLGVSTAWAQTQGQTVKIAWIDPLSGLMAPVGSNQLRSFQFFAEKFSGAGNPAGVKFEVIGLDNKLSPQESVNQLKAALDQGVRYITQGNGTSVAVALIDAIAKHNERNPGQEVVFLNHSAIDPDLTGVKCNYWHFRFDADTSMKMGAMTSFIKDQKDVKKVYLMNQNYAHGHQVAKYAKDLLAEKRPDVQVVGEDLTPLAQVRDFSPYIAKIKASGADTVITGNWGSDLSLLVKAAIEGGYNGKFYTYYAGVTGTPTALGSGGAGKVYQVSYNTSYMGGDYEKWQQEYKAKFKEDYYTGSVFHIFRALGEAMAQAKSTDPVQVAKTLEGLKFKSYNGDVEMRATDHQLQQPLYITVWQKADKKHKYTMESTDMTFVPVRQFTAAQASTPSVCQMQRP